MVDEATKLIMEQLHILRRGQETHQLALEAMREEVRTDIAELKEWLVRIERRFDRVDA